MPRKLNEMPKIASENRNENPKTFPSVEKPSNKPTKQDKRSAESALRSHMEDEDLVTTSALRETRELLKKGSKSTSDQISETNVEADFFGESSPDRTAAKILKESVAQQKREDEAQATMKEIAKATNFTEKEIGDWLEQQAIDKAAAEPENWRTRFAKSVKTIAGKLVGKDVSKLEAYKEKYLAAQALVNVSKNKAVEKMQDTPGSRPSLGGNRLISRGEAQKSSFSTKNPEVTASKEEESNPGGTANALLEKYRVAIGKGRTVSKEGVLTYEDQGTEELSVADLVKSQTLLSEAYNQIYAKNKKDAKAFAEAVGTIRYENNNSALATEDVATGRAVAAGRKQADVGSGALKTAGRGAGSSSLDRGLSDILQNLDTKLAKAELATVGAEAPIAAPKETPLKGDLSAAQMREFDEANARMNGGRMVKPGTVDRISATDAAALDSTIEQINKNEQMQLTREVEYLAGFSEGDARRAFKLMAPNTPAARLKEITSNTVADTYRAMVNEASALKNSKSMASQSKLTALNDKLDAVRSFAATISVQEAKLAEMPSIREAYTKKAAAENRAEFLDDKDIELIEEEPAQPVKRKAPPKVSAAAKAVGRKKN